MVAQKGEKTSREMEIVGSIPLKKFFFTVGPSLTIVKSVWTHVWHLKILIWSSAWNSTDKELHLEVHSIDSYLEFGTGTCQHS